MTEIGNRQALDLEALGLGGDGFSHDCPPIHAGKGDVVCAACGTAWRWVEDEDPQRCHWLELTPAELIAERDRARSAAVALFEELAVKDQAIEDIRALAEDALDADGGASFAGMFGALTEAQRVLADLSARLDQDKGDNHE